MITLSKNNLYSVNEPTEVNLENFNVLQYGLSLMVESNNEIMQVMDHNLIINESGDSKFNIVNILNSIVEIFCNIIKKLCDKVIEILIWMGSKGKSFELELKHYSERMKKFSGYIIIESNDKMYRYTKITPNKDYFNNLCNDFKNSMNYYIRRFNEIIAMKDASSISEQLSALIDQNKMEEKVGNFRYSLLNPGKHGYFDKNQFKTYCYNTFRGASGEIPSEAYEYTKLNINSDELYNNIYIPYINRDKNIKELKREKAKIQAAAKDAKDDINKFNADFSRFTDQSKETLNLALMNTQKTICNLFNEECQATVTMYTERLQAYKDFNVQARYILLKSMQYLATHK